MSLADLRREYQQTLLDEQSVERDPIHQFQQWFDQAQQADQPDPTAMTVATVTADGQPAARIMLLKGVEDGRFVFFTNYLSDKARELEANAKAAMVFFWNVLDRQVRVSGIVSKVSQQVSREYFQTRPRGSQIGAWVSQQSSVIESRAVLEAKLAELEKQYEGQDVPCPEHWGGYQLVPDVIEFWQGRPDRLHDRLRYSRAGDQGWRLERLSP